MRSPAFFISPKGQVIDTEINHIATIVSYPKKFGLTKDYIQAVYDKYNEKVNIEGKAREEIIKRLIKSGWIRIRKYKQFWSVNVNKFTGKVKAELQMWAYNLIQGKIPSYKEQDVYMDVRIDDGMQVWTSKLKVMAQGGLREDKENIEVDSKLYKVEELEDLEPYDFVKEELENAS